MTSLACPTHLRQYLQALDKRPSRFLSQNFLVDDNIVQNFVERAQIKEGDLVLEIGPGPGVFTQEILNRGARVIAVEKDSTLAHGLREQHRGSHSIEVIEGDFLDLDLSSILPKGRQVKVVSNLPFKLTSPILAKLFPLYEQISSCLFIMQREVAERILASSKSKAFSTLTLFSHFYTTPSFCFHISPNCFFPKPKVTCSVVSFELHPPLLDEAELFFDFVKKAFQQRRKMLSSTLPLPSQRVKEVLLKLGHSDKARPEELNTEQWIELYQHLL